MSQYGVALRLLRCAQYASASRYAGGIRARLAPPIGMSQYGVALRLLRCAQYAFASRYAVGIRARLAPPIGMSQYGVALRLLRCAQYAFASRYAVGIRAFFFTLSVARLRVLGNWITLLRGCFSTSVVVVRT